MCVCVCLSVCLSRLRSRERDVRAPRFLHRRKELHMASCTNRFSKRYDAPLERKVFGPFPRLRVDGRVPRKDFRFYKVLKGSVLRDTPFTYTTLNLPVRERVSQTKTYQFVNGFLYPRPTRS